MRATTLVDTQQHHDATWLSIGNTEGRVHLKNTFFVCPNPECRKFTLWVQLYKTVVQQGGGTKDGALLFARQLVPDSSARSFPDTVPEFLQRDYREACSIKDLSPKASATLSRRCLQGMIRDFWGIVDKTLFAEIAALEDRVEPEVWAAIDAVRSIGNIGAHMEKDVNLIVEVEPEEAGQLISLIETLFEDWYIARAARAKRMKDLAALGAKKAAEKKAPEV